MLFIDSQKTGFDRNTLVKVLEAEGVQVSFGDYPEQHKMKIYAEAKWWHHAPQIPGSMPGNAYVNGTTFPAGPLRRSARTHRTIHAGVREGLGAPGGVGESLSRYQNFFFSPGKLIRSARTFPFSLIRASV